MVKKKKKRPGFKGYQVNRLEGGRFQQIFFKQTEIEARKIADDWAQQGAQFTAWIVWSNGRTKKTIYRINGLVGPNADKNADTMRQYLVESGVDLEEAKYRIAQKRHSHFKTELERRATPEEKIVKAHLESIGIRFQFQRGLLKPFHRIVDFYIPKKSRPVGMGPLIIEIDGLYHENIAAKDRRKDLVAKQVRHMDTLRITNAQVTSGEFRDILVAHGVVGLGVQSATRRIARAHQIMDTAEKNMSIATKPLWADRPKPPARILRASLND